MAVDVHPSRKPSKPAKPPATSTTDGRPNTVAKTDTGSGKMTYGANMDLHIKPSHKSERAHDFKDLGACDGSAGRAGREEPQEGPKGKASRPGDEKGNDEPG